MQVQTGYLYHIKVSLFVERQIINDFKYMLSLKETRLNLFFTDIDFIKNIIEEKLEKV